VKALAAQINKDPDLEVSFKVAGDDGGYHIRSKFNGTTFYWWGFEAHFRNKADNSDAGKALLKLCGNYPETANIDIDYVGDHGTQVDITCDAGREKVIRNLVSQAARSMGTAEISQQLDTAIDTAIIASNRALQPA